MFNLKIKNMKMNKQDFEKSFNFSPSIENDDKISFILRKNSFKENPDGKEFFSFTFHEPPKNLIKMLTDPERNKEVLEPIKDLIYKMYLNIYK